MRDQLEQVRPLDGIAAREHEDGRLHLRYLADQVLALRRGEFQRMAIRLSRCAAMHAGQIAGLSNLPNGDERALVEVDGVDSRIHMPMKLCDRFLSSIGSDQSLNC